MERIIIILIVIASILNLWILEGRKEEGKEPFVEIIAENITIGGGAYQEIVLNVRALNDYHDFVDVRVYSANASLYFIAAYPEEHIEGFDRDSVHFFIRRLNNETLTIFPSPPPEGNYTIHIRYSWKGQIRYVTKDIAVHSIGG